MSPKTHLFHYSIIHIESIPTEVKILSIFELIKMSVFKIILEYGVTQKQTITCCHHLNLLTI